MNKAVLLASKPDCPACVVMETRLRNAGVTYTKATITPTHALYQKAVESGIRTLPFVVIEGKIHTTWGQVSAALGVV